MSENRSTVKGLAYLSMAGVCMYAIAVSDADPHRLNALLLRWVREAMSVIGL